MTIAAAAECAAVFCLGFTKGDDTTVKTLYIECNMGASGSMLLSALFELIEEKDQFLERMNRLGLPGVRVKSYAAQTCGIAGTSVSVRMDERRESSGHRSHRDTKLENIRTVIRDLPITPQLKTQILAVYRELAEAKSKVRGKSVEDVHFHEIGQLDAIAAITGVCMLMEIIGAEKVIISPICTGTGAVQTKYGSFPIPSPSLTELLRGIPSYGGEIEEELCSPIGAALLKIFATDFGTMPEMPTPKTGIGVGRKNLDRANCMRVFLGDTFDRKSVSPKTETVELRANLDDMTPEMLAEAADILTENGALDVYTVPIFNKKHHPAFMLNCLCGYEDAEKFAGLMLKHTTATEVRHVALVRYTMDTGMEECATPYGSVQVQHAAGFGTRKDKVSFEDVRRIAREQETPVYIMQHKLMK